MAKLYVTEYVQNGVNNTYPTATPLEPGVDQVVTFTTTTQSTAFAANTTLVRIHTDSICSISFGTNPTATTSTKRLVAGATEYFSVPPGAAYKVAAVTNT